MDCYYCGKHMPAGSSYGFHTVCRALFERRRDAGKCVDCGRAPAKTHMSCAKCWRSGLMFGRYPGPRVRRKPRAARPPGT